LALLAIAAIWGATFVLVQDAVERTPPMLFLTMRFAIASVAMAGGLRRATKQEWSVGALLGCVLFAGYALQTVGLQYTSASNAGFLTGLFVVFTPIIGALVVRALPSPAATAGVVLATAGMALLTMPAGLSIGKGDALEILTAVSFATHIVLTGLLARGLSALALAGIQIVVVTAISFGWSAIAEATLPAGDGLVWFVAAFTAVFATALAFFVQTRAQQQLPPVRTAVILAAEPAFAGIAGYVVAGDRFGVRGMMGAFMILAGILVASLRPPEREQI
jgi:drug/metabolite transporter (DMT)-like permease